MLSLLVSSPDVLFAASRSLIAQLPPEPPVVPADGGSIIALVAFALFFVAFFAVGIVFLRKRRAERIDALTRELDKPLEGAGAEPAALEGAAPRGELPAAGEALPVPKASELAAAERAAVLARAKEDEARRARERAEAAAREAADAEAHARLEAAKAREAEAAASAAEAHERARQLRLALTATRDGLVGRLQKAIGSKQIDAGVLDDVEAVLFGADIGARTAERLLNAVKKKLSARELSSFGRVEETLRDEAAGILGSVAVEPLALEGEKPRVILVLGVNGAGKTTTIGKLAAQLKGQGHKVLLGAGDTFRAAAADQLEVWADRAGVPIVTGPDNADPSSVLFDSVKKAKAEGFDVVLCDTAGRLHTKVNLMEELRKVARSLAKAAEGAPHEVLLVLDATVGQNAIAQAKQFGEAAPLTGIVLTKLDGTAKGGVILGIVDELKVPVRYIGVGEKIGDLRPFSPDDFLAALFADDAARAAAE
jgi:fused signal recognition particle receptor